MRDQLNERVAALKADFERGKTRLEELEAEADKLRETLLRISGAVQVLTEELARSEADADDPAGGPP